MHSLGLFPVLSLCFPCVYENVIIQLYMLSYLQLLQILTPWSHTPKQILSSLRSCFRSWHFIVPTENSLVHHLWESQSPILQLNFLFWRGLLTLGCVFFESFIAVQSRILFGAFVDKGPHLVFTQVRSSLHLIASKRGSHYGVVLHRLGALCFIWLFLSFADFLDVSCFFFSFYH